jgi:hypothetical protein
MPTRAGLTTIIPLVREFAAAAIASGFVTRAIAKAGVQRAVAPGG